MAAVSCDDKQYGKSADDIKAIDSVWFKFNDKKIKRVFQIFLQKEVFVRRG